MTQQMRACHLHERVADVVELRYERGGGGWGGKLEEDFPAGVSDRESLSHDVKGYTSQDALDKFKAAPVGQVLKQRGVCVSETAQRSVESGNHLQAQAGERVITCSCEQQCTRECKLRRQSIGARAFGRGAGHERMGFSQMVDSQGIMGQERSNCLHIKLHNV